MTTFEIVTNASLKCSLFAGNDKCIKSFFFTFGNKNLIVILCHACYTYIFHNEVHVHNQVK